MRLFQKYGLAIGVFVISAILFSQQMALAATCKINGQEVPCESLGKVAKSAVGYGFGLFALFFILMIAGTIFWILMIIHAASKPIENRPMWVVIIVLTGLLGAIIYYFVVKRNFKEETTSAVLPPTQPPVQPPTQQVS